MRDIDDDANLIDTIYDAALDAGYDGPWQREDMRALPEITPHARRAALADQRIGDLCTVHWLAQEALHQLEHGIFLIGSQSQVLFANRAAEALLAGGDGLRLERQWLTTRRTADTAVLRRLIGAAVAGGAGGSLVLGREARPSLLVLVMPVRPGSFLFAGDSAPGAVLMIKDLERPAKPCLTAFTRHFGLTPAQSAMARELLQGDGVAAAAARLGISYGTARTHLLQIFQKTTTSRQTELIRVMLDWNEGSAVLQNGSACHQRPARCSRPARGQR